MPVFSRAFRIFTLTFLPHCVHTYMDAHSFGSVGMWINVFAYASIYEQELLLRAVTHTLIHYFYAHMQHLQDICIYVYIHK